MTPPRQMIPPRPTAGPQPRSSPNQGVTIGAEDAPGVTAEVENGGRATAASAAQIDGRYPRRPLGRAHCQKREGEPPHDRLRAVRQHAQNRKTAPAAMPAIGTIRRPAIPRACSSRSDNRPPSGIRWPCQRRNGCVMVTLLDRKLQHLLEVITHPVEKHVLKITDGTISQGKQHKAPASREIAPEAGPGCPVRGSSGTTTIILPPGRSEAQRARIEAAATVTPPMIQERAGPLDVFDRSTRQIPGCRAAIPTSAEPLISPLIRDRATAGTPVAHDPRALVEPVVFISFYP